MSDRGECAGVDTSELVVEDRAAFDDWLRDWFSNTRSETIADAGSEDGRACVRVCVAGEWCHLSADTSRAGVFQYFQHMRLAGGVLDWHVVADRCGGFNRIGVGRCKRPLTGFYLFPDEPFADSHRLA